KVVDQWLGRRSVGAAEVHAVASAAAPSIGSPVAPPLQSFTQLEPKSSQPASRQTPPKPVPFVCEDDVRAAILSHSKIVVDKRTIITPSARDLAEANDTFITL